MEDVNAHPNTQALLDAWRRLSLGATATVGGPTTEDYPDLVGRLFVLNHVGDRDCCFRRVGYAMERLFGRQLVEHNFLSLWSEPDRRLVSAALVVAASDRGPALIRARGETLTGRRVDLEFALAPLLGGEGVPRRFLWPLPVDDGRRPAARTAAAPPAGHRTLSACPQPRSRDPAGQLQMKSRPPAPHCLSRQHPELARSNGSGVGPLSGRTAPSVPEQKPSQTPPRKHL